MRMLAVVCTLQVDKENKQKGQERVRRKNILVNNSTNSLVSKIVN